MEPVTILIFFTAVKNTLDKLLSAGYPLITYLEFWLLDQFTSFAVVTKDWTFPLCPRKVTEQNTEALALSINLM